MVIQIIQKIQLLQHSEFLTVKLVIVKSIVQGGQTLARTHTHTRVKNSQISTNIVTGPNIYIKI